MYRIADIETSYRPKAQEFLSAGKEVTEYARKIAKEHGYTDYDIWTSKVYGWKWNIEIYNNN